LSRKSGVASATASPEVLAMLVASSHRVQQARAATRGEHAALLSF
jgi:hypothetical protein